MALNGLSRANRTAFIGQVWATAAHREAQKAEGFKISSQSWVVPRIFT
jgi:hypothetical protein